MRFICHGHIDAAYERPEITDRTDLSVSVLSTGGTGAIHIGGTMTDRAAWLEQLADAASSAAGELRIVASEVCS